MKQRKYRPSFWLLFGLGVTLVQTLLIGTIFVVYRNIVQNQYLSRMKQRIETCMVELRDAGFSQEAASRIEEKGVNILIYRGASANVWYRSMRGPMFYLPSDAQTSLPGVSDATAYYDFLYLSDLVQSHLGTENGAVCVTEHNEPVEDDLHGCQELFLIGRQGPYLFSMSMHLTNANDAITMAVHSAAIVWSIGWAVCLLLIFIISRIRRRAHMHILRITGKIAELDFSERCPPKLTREMDSFSQSINTMSDRLQENITALRQTNLRLQDELAEREHQQKLNSELIANISHDLKTPIAVIGGCVEGLQEGVASAPEQRERYYEAIASENEHMLTIVTKLLALSRADRRAPLTPADFDLARLIDEVQETYEPEIARRGVEVTLDYGRPLPVHADRASIRQCLYQFAQNALSYLDERKQIRVHAEPDGGFCRVSIRNSGGPIPASELPKLWDRLYRLDNARSREEGRAGVGLAIVKSLLERQSIEYGCRNLEGSVEFWFRLPLAQTGEADAAEPTADA